MRLGCPSCATSFEVDPAALEPNGRTVRCAQCKVTWFAPAPHHALAMVEASAAPGQLPAPELSDADRSDHAQRAVKIVSWEDAELVEAESPSISAEADAFSPKPVPARKRAAAHRLSSSQQRLSPLMALTVILAGVFALGIVGRQALVRALPETATLFASIGFPVNLRGLEFQNIKTTREIQDSIPVLVIQGEVENVAGRAVELPRVRLSVLGENGAEIYAWTALLQRSILYPRERISFRSRLASPPEGGTELMVRFLTRGDLTAGIR